MPSDPILDVSLALSVGAVVCSVDFAFAVVLYLTGLFFWALKNLSSNEPEL